MAIEQQSVVGLQRSQQDRAAETLTSAFRDDPLFAYLIPNDARRLGLARLIHRASVRYGLLYGEVYVTSDVSGVAIWLVPGRTTVTLWRMLRAGALTVRRELGEEGFGRLVRYFEQSSRVAQEHAPMRHWHLFQLGVAPTSQGQGLGGTLIQPVLQRADAEGLPCYLDTFNAKALEFYGKHRFRLVTEAQVPDDGPRFWTVLRDPVQ